MPPVFVSIRAGSCPSLAALGQSLGSNGTKSNAVLVAGDGAIGVPDPHASARACAATPPPSSSVRLVKVGGVDSDTGGYASRIRAVTHAPRQVMELVEHRNCIMLHEVYDEPLTICLVMDLVTGGELFDRIIAKGFYSEKDAAEVTREVLQVGAGRATHTVRLTAVAIRGG